MKSMKEQQTVQCDFLKPRYSSRNESKNGTRLLWDTEENTFFLFTIPFSWKKNQFAKLIQQWKGKGLTDEDN